MDEISAHLSQNTSLVFNNLLKQFSYKQINYQCCEICFDSNNLLNCVICKNNYHNKCLPNNHTNLIKQFICHECLLLPSLDTILQSNQPLSIYDLTAKQKQEHQKPFNSNLKEKRKRGEEKLQIKQPKRHFISTSTITPQTQSIDKKIKRKGIQGQTSIIQKREKENKILISFEHSNPQYKRRKIKIGINYNIDMYEYTDRYENQINFDEEEYERQQLKQVWSFSLNPLSNEQINAYLKSARLFWTYRNMFLENELCFAFFEECERVMKGKKHCEKLKNKINKLLSDLRGLLRRGVDLNCHYDEMAFKMLHICRYKTKVALLFLYKQLNPFIEEIEEGFKNDVVFFQSEIISIINDGDIDIDE